MFVDFEELGVQNTSLLVLQRARALFLYSPLLYNNMMRQAANPPNSLNASIQITPVTEIEVTKDMRVDVLNVSSKTAICKTKDRKSLLVRYSNLKKDCIDQAAILDSLSGTSMASRFKDLIKSKTEFNSMNKDTSSRALVNLCDISCLFLQLLEEQSTGLRSSSQTPLMILLRDVKEVKTKVDRQAIANIHDTESDPILKGRTLTPKQREREFDHNLIPDDEGHRCCLFCKHPSMNEAPENKQVVTLNKQRLKEAKDAQDIWNKHVAAKSDAEKKNLPLAPTNPLNPNTNKAMNRAPNNAKLDYLFQQCLCINSHCAQEGTDLGSSCPISCTDAETGSRYPFVRGRCSCPMCKCQCGKSYNICDQAKIGLRLDMHEKAKQMRPSPVSAEEQCSTFIGSLFGSALVASGDTSHSTNKNAEQVVQDAFYANMATNAVQKAANLGHEGRTLLRAKFGTDRTVVLPGGQELNTSSISKDPNFHDKNNRLINNLSASSSHLPIAPGMKTRLEPSYEILTDHFKQSALNGTSLASAIAHGFVSPPLDPSGNGSGSVNGSASFPPTPVYYASSVARGTGIINIDNDDSPRFVKGRVWRSGDSIIEIDLDRKMPAKEEGPSPCTKLHERLLDRCRRDKKLDKDKGNLSVQEREERKSAKKRQRSIIQEGSNRISRRHYAREIGKTMKLNDDAAIENSIDCGIFESQDALRFFENGFMDSDEE